VFQNIISAESCTGTKYSLARYKIALTFLHRKSTKRKTRAPSVFICYRQSQGNGWSAGSSAGRWGLHSHHSPAVPSAASRSYLRPARCAHCLSPPYSWPRGPQRPDRRTPAWEEPAHARRRTGTSETSRGLLLETGGATAAAADGARVGAVPIGRGGAAARAGILGTGGTRAAPVAGATGAEPAGGSPARPAAGRPSPQNTPRRGGRRPSESLPSLAASPQAAPAGGKAAGLSRLGSRRHCRICHRWSCSREGRSLRVASVLARERES
jgi:hypothetical protein